MADGWALLVRRLVTSILFKLFRLLFVAVQRLYWELNGTAQKLREADDPRYYERSAQVLDVLAFGYFCEMQAHSIEHALCVHNRFENPQYIIDNEHVTLYTINDRYAVFSVAPDKGMQVWKSEFSSFIRLAQMQNTKQFIVVPLKVFHRMAEKIGDPKGELIFIFNTARCGSTLLTQVMEYTGRCVSLSEPDTSATVAMKYRNEGDTPEVRQLARDVVRWECRPYPSMQPPPLAYVLKLVSPAAVALPLFKELYPNSRNMFMYRDVTKTSKSLYRMSYPLPTIFLTYKLGRFSGAAVEYMVNMMGLNGRDFRMRLTDDLQFGVILTCIVTKIYLELRRKGSSDIVAVRYEDLVGNPKESLRRILEYCRLPTELVEPGLRGLEVDSQRNSMISKSAIGSVREPDLTPETVATANGLLKKYGLPLIGEEFIVEGTITSKK